MNNVHHTDWLVSKLDLEYHKMQALQASEWCGWSSVMWSETIGLRTRGPRAKAPTAPWLHQLWAMWRQYRLICSPNFLDGWLADYFAAKPSTVRQIFSETIKIVQMLLAVPASAASAERTFSSLRRLKTWLRQTMTQKRLFHFTHLAVLHCRRQRAENVDIEHLCEKFALKTN